MANYFSNTLAELIVALQRPALHDTHAKGRAVPVGGLLLHTLDAFVFPHNVFLLGHLSSLLGQ